MARERGGYGEERYEKEEMQGRVRAEFGRVREMMEREGKGWVGVDAGRSREEVQEEVWKVVEPVLKSKKSPIGRLAFSSSVASSL